MKLFEELVRVAGALDDAEVSYAVCGAIAVAVHGHVRATQDIDLLIDASRLDEVRRILGDLAYLHPTSAIPYHPSTDAVNRRFRLTKVLDSSHLTVDLLLAESDLWTGTLARRERQELEYATIAVVTRADLIAMKRESGRPLDQDDIDRLPADG